MRRRRGLTREVEREAIVGERGGEKEVVGGEGEDKRGVEEEKNWREKGRVQGYKGNERREEGVEDIKPGEERD